MSKDSVHTKDTVIGRAFRRSLLSIVAIGSLIAIAIAWFNRPAGEREAGTESVVSGPRAVQSRTSPTAPAIAFTDITGAAGIGFEHVNGAIGEKLLPETMGGGVAFLDYDQDGDQDLFLVNSMPWPNGKGEAQAFSALYRNDGSGRFEEVTREAGLDRSQYGMGVAAGDYDNDGDPDLYVTAVGENRLFRNDNGTFSDVTGTAGVAGDPGEWSTSATFVDVDNDGDLDLFVANYVRWTRDIDFEIDFRLTGIGRAYGPPTTFEGRHPYLYANNGDGTFTDVSAESGVQVANPATGAAMGKALGVSPLDVNRDGWMDLFVANDTVRNFLFVNRGDGSFDEKGVTMGISFDRNGAATGAMGTDSAYYRDDGELGLAVGNFANEMTSLYVTRDGDGQFADEAISDGIGPASRKALTFGLFFFDYDLDGRLDLFQANGHLEDEINVVQPSQHYAQPAQLFWNCGVECPVTFVEVSAGTSGDLATPVVGRGASFADIDGDGDLDIVVTQTGGRPLLLRNDQATGHRWLRVALTGTRSNRDAIGAWVEISADGRRQIRQVTPTRSYLSQSERTVTFGLGSADGADEVRVLWPDGSEQRLGPVEANQTLDIRQEAEPN